MNRAEPIPSNYTELSEPVPFAEKDGKMIYIVAERSNFEKLLSLGTKDAPVSLDRWLKMTNGGAGWIFINEA